MKKKGFTLIELIAVLVILAILALIVTPLVMNIIRKARIAADKRSVDAYGRSVELAVATYLLDEGKFPTSINQLTIEYTGDQVVCSTAQLNSDSSVYLTGCTVGGRSVDYTYGTDKTPPSYSVGDEVRYNNVDYYVIANSGSDSTTVKLIKKTPLTASEINQHGGVGTANNHVNMYTTNDTTASNYQQADNIKNIGGVAYYSSATCGYGIYDGCTANYAQSEIKYVVDSWAQANVPNGLEEARLIRVDEIETEQREYQPCSSCGSVMKEFVKYDWLYNSDYAYWTMSEGAESGKGTIVMWSGSFDTYTPVMQSSFYSTGVVNSIAVRPVIVLSKSVLI